jgi:3-methylcrotonyl-CoA carboxylase alpha subunit
MKWRKVLIANRGEIAVRLIRACQTLGLKAVAVYSEADASAYHVREADEAAYLGPALSAESYLRGERLIQAALDHACQALHPGYGFLSENAAFAQAVREAGLVFIGPPTEAIRLMGDKTQARARVASVGVPLLAGFQGPKADFPREAERIGYPLLVKASAGGGGKGLRLVQNPDDLASAVEAAEREALAAFGDGTLFLEKFLPRAYHVEVQVLGDEGGRLVHLFERECSIQRRHQKIIEESPSPRLNAELRQRMGASAVSAARAVGYTNAGTVEFLLDEAGHYTFLEMNTRLQVEHPVTEAVTGLDLVRLQFQVAMGQPLPFEQSDLRLRGHAIQARLYAEDPTQDFLPSTGRLDWLEFPHYPFFRVDSGYQSGDEVTPYYDPLLAKLIAYGSERESARQTLVTALAQTRAFGFRHNLDFLQAILSHPAFIAGDTPIDFLTRYPIHLPPVSYTHLRAHET